MLTCESKLRGSLASAGASLYRVNNQFLIYGLILTSSLFDELLGYNTGVIVTLCLIPSCPGPSCWISKANRFLHTLLKLAFSAHINLKVALPNGPLLL